MQDAGCRMQDAVLPRSRTGQDHVIRCCSGGQILAKLRKSVSLLLFVTPEFGSLHVCGILHMPSPQPSESLSESARALVRIHRHDGAHPRFRQASHRDTLCPEAILYVSGWPIHLFGPPCRLPKTETMNNTKKTPISWVFDFLSVGTAVDDSIAPSHERRSASCSCFLLLLQELSTPTGLSRWSCRDDRKAPSRRC